MIMQRRAVFSEDRQYRYLLERVWNEKHPPIGFVLHNPSTADENQEDPTLRRCLDFAQRWGYGSLRLGNLFAFRATNPADMRKAPDPIGQDNDRYLRDIADTCLVVIAGWGALTVAWQTKQRDRVLLLLGGDLRCLRVTKNGDAQHPLYIPKTATPQWYPYPKQPGETRQGEGDTDEQATH